MHCNTLPITPWTLRYHIMLKQYTATHYTLQLYKTLFLQHITVTVYYTLQFYNTLHSFTLEHTAVTLHSSVIQHTAFTLQFCSTLHSHYTTHTTVTLHTKLLQHLHWHCIRVQNTFFTLYTAIIERTAFSQQFCNTLHSQDTLHTFTTHCIHTTHCTFTHEVQKRKLADFSTAKYFLGVCYI